jgi:hypothetical protein
MPTWAEPDPASAQRVRLGPLFSVQVIESRGDWAHIRSAAGADGWVDARRLVPLAPVAARAMSPVVPPAPTAPTTAVLPATAAVPAASAAAEPRAARPSVLAGKRLAVAYSLGVALIFAAPLLNWGRGFWNGAGSAYSRLPIGYLAIFRDGGYHAGFAWGYLLLACAIVAMVTCFLTGRRWLGRVAGVVAGLVPVLYFVQVYRALVPYHYFQSPLVFIGIGAYAALAGGLLVACIRPPRLSRVRRRGTA